MSQLKYRPKAIVFDVNETLFSIESIRSRFESLGLPRHALEWWFAVVFMVGARISRCGRFSVSRIWQYRHFPKFLKPWVSASMEGLLRSPWPDWLNYSLIQMLNPL